MCAVLFSIQQVALMHCFVFPDGFKEHDDGELKRKEIRFKYEDNMYCPYPLSIQMNYSELQCLLKWILLHSVDTPYEEQYVECLRDCKASYCFNITFICFLCYEAGME